MKNKKIIILLLVVCVIVGGVIICQKNKLFKVDNKKQVGVVEKDILKNKISYIDGYIDLNFKIKDGVLNNENVKIWTSWAEVSSFSFKDGFVSFSLGSPMWKIINGKTLVDNVYIVQDGIETKLSVGDVKGWDQKELVNFQIYYTEDIVSVNNIFTKMIEQLIPSVKARSWSTDNMKNIKKIVFYFPEYQLGQDIKVNNIYVVDSREEVRVALPAMEEGLNLIVDKEIEELNNKAFFVIKNRGKTYLTLKGGADLIEISSYANIPFSSIVDYNLIGNFVCSYFNEYCFFIVSDAIVHTNLELIDGKMKSLFEYNFAEKNPLYSLDEKDGKYFLNLWEHSGYEGYDEYIGHDLIDQSINIDMTDFVKNNEDKIDRDNNYNGVFINNNIYVKGNVECVKDTTRDISNIECIVIPDIVRVID